MIRISVKANIDSTIRWLNDVQRSQVPHAQAVALTRTAKLVQAAEIAEIRRTFDRPTQYTLGSVFMKPATKSRPVAKVWLKSKLDAGKGTAAEDYLLPQIEGGARKLKRFERALQAVGAMPPGYFAVPGSAAKLDSAGNMDRGQIVKILSYFRAFPEAGYRANITARRKAALARRGDAYFIGQPRGAPLGIWYRRTSALGSAIKPVIIFVTRPTYQKLFRFFEVASRVIRTEFPGQFRIALAEALRTAR